MGEDLPAILAFVHAQVDEDERLARAATEGPWRAVEMSIRGYSGPNRTDVMVVRHTWPQESAHIIRWDPDRALRELAAKRRRLARHHPVAASDTDWVSCAYCSVTWPCEDVRDDLACYSDRSGYRAEWKP